MAVHAATTPSAVPATPAPGSRYVGNLPVCDKCNFHHHGSCHEMLCNNCGKKGHTTRFCKTQVQPTNQAPGAGVSQVFYACGEIGHFKRNFPKATTDNTWKVLSMGQEEAVVDPTVVTGTFLLDNSYSCILFDSGA